MKPWNHTSMVRPDERSLIALDSPHETVDVAILKPVGLGIPPAKGKLTKRVGKQKEVLMAPKRAVASLVVFLLIHVNPKSGVILGCVVLLIPNFLVSG